MTYLLSTQGLGLFGCRPFEIIELFLMGNLWNLCSELVCLLYKLSQWWECYWSSSDQGWSCSLYRIISKLIYPELGAVCSRISVAPSWNPSWAARHHNHRPSCTLYLGDPTFPSHNSCFPFDNLQINPFNVIHCSGVSRPSAYFEGSPVRPICWHHEAG